MGNNGKCLPVRNDIGKNGYECECPAPFWGDRCQLDRCEAAPCLNNGKCLPGRNNLGEVVYECECTSRFSGDACQTYSGHDISRSLTNQCPGQGLYVFNEENKDETKQIIISQYFDNMECWWYISNTLGTGHLELSFSYFKSENADYLQIFK